MHHVEQYLYELLIEFQENVGSEGVEITENDLLLSWKKAKNKTGYFKGNK